MKTRRSNVFVDPLLAINKEKVKNLRYAIFHYLHYRKIEKPWRFDAITVVGVKGQKSPVINHYEDIML